MKRPIAIVFVNLKGNIGDFAILHSMLLHAQTHHAGQPVHIWPHSFVPVDTERLREFRRRAPAFELKESDLFADTPPKYIQTRLLRAFGLLRRHQADRIDRITAQAKDRAKIFAEYEAVYVAGGAQWTGTVSGVSMFGGLRAIAAHNPRIFAFPVSVSSSIHKLNTKEILRDDLAHVQAPLVTRDSASAVLLRDLGLQVLEGADCVFSLHREGEVIPAASSSTPDRVLICVTGQPETALRAAISTLHAEGYSIALLTTCEMEDAPVQKPLAAEFGVPFLSPATWQEAVAEMKASGLVVTNRLHGYILNSFTSVPVLPLTDRSKVKAVVTDASLPLRLERLTDLDGSKVDKVRARKDEILSLSMAYRDAALGKQRAPAVGDH